MIRNKKTEKLILWITKVSNFTSNNLKILKVMKRVWHVAISRVFQIQQMYFAEKNNWTLWTVFGMISNTKGWKKNRINDESMENWSALHINGRKVHYREQSLVVATAKIIIMSALGLGPTLAWRHRVHRSQKIP